VTPLASPDHAVLGASDLEAAVAFYRRFGFDQTWHGVLAAEPARLLYGLGRETRQSWLAAAGGRPGGLRLVETPHPAEQTGPCDHGPHAIDIYTRDIGASRALAAAAGARTGPIARYAVGPLEIQETKAVGPDSVALVFIQVSRRRPSLLDDDETRQHSELHSVVWVVDSVDDALGFWRDRAGLRPFLDATLRNPDVAAFMELPRPQTPLRLAMLADAELRPVRLELIEFPEDPGAAAKPGPLRAGLHASVFRVAALGDARAALAGAQLGASTPLETPAGRRLACAAVAPGGVAFELLADAP